MNINDFVRKRDFYYFEKDTDFFKYCWVPINFPIKYKQTSEYLKEEYSKLNINEYNILSSIDNAVDDYNNLDMKDIIDNLNHEFTKCRITFTLDIQKQPMQYPHTGIIKGEYNPNNYLFYISVSPDFIKKLKGSLEDWKDITKDLFFLYTHEFVHQHQANTGNLERMKSPYPPENNSIKERKKYLSNVHEIDARARETAAQILNRYKIKQELHHALKNSKNQLNELSKNYNAYYELFNQSKDREDQKVWKRFLKRLYDFIQLDSDIYSNGFQSLEKLKKKK